MWDPLLGREFWQQLRVYCVHCSYSQRSFLIQRGIVHSSSSRLCHGPSAHPLLGKENLSLCHMLFSKEPIRLSSEYLLASHFQVCYTLHSQSLLSPVQALAADRFCLWCMCFVCLHFCFGAPGAVVSLSAFVHYQWPGFWVCLFSFFFFFGQVVL